MAQSVSRVLVVEDEFLIRMGAAVVLSDAGYHVIEAERADEAHAVLQTRAAEIHAIFTDVHVPGKLSGMELAHLAQRLWPWIAILIASGRSRPATRELPVGSRFISKPYNPNHVVGHLQEMLRVGRGPSIH